MNAVNRAKFSSRTEAPYPDSVLRNLGAMLLCLILVLPIAQDSRAQSGLSELRAGRDDSRQAPERKQPVKATPFRVVIPEIKMRSIIGGGKKAPGTPSEKPSSPPKVPSRQPTSPREELPDQLHAPKKDSPPPGPSGTSEPSSGAPKAVEVPMMKPPAAPEDAVEAVKPRTETLKIKRGGGTIELLHPKHISTERKPARLESSQIDGEVPQGEWLPFQPRRAPEMVPSSDPEPGREFDSDPPAPSPSPSGQLPPPGGGSFHESPRPEPHLPSGSGSDQQSAEGLHPAPSIRTETPPSDSLPGSQEPGLSAIPPALPPQVAPPPVVREDRPAAEGPTAKEAPAEFMVSPLDLDAIGSPEAKSYLQETSPILEKLSLLMTRVPSLTIADYDPSEAKSPTIPQDLFRQMESLKRSLRILDSKTFEIMPPAQFERFHKVIRESIAQTGRACDSIIDYFTRGDTAALEAMQRHLLKARELIRATRRRT